jgi:hypothetical protein
MGIYAVREVLASVHEVEGRCSALRVSKSESSNQGYRSIYYPWFKLAALQAPAVTPSPSATQQ